MGGTGMNHIQEIEERKYYVYAHTRPDTNNYFYIGLGFNNRAYCRSGRNIYWKRIVGKNKGDYSVDLLATKLTKSEACKLEIQLIKFYGRNDLHEGVLCNMSDGGETNVGRKYTESEIAKAKLRTGENHNMYGIPKPESVKRKISQAKTGVRMSENNALKISVALKEKYKHTQHHSLGSKATDEVKLKISEGLRRAVREGRRNITYTSGSSHVQCKGDVYQYCKNTGELLGVYESTGLAEKATGVHSGRITAVILGSRSHSKGFVFKRL